MLKSKKMDNIVNKTITDLLPHREPFIFLDKVVSMEGLNRITATRTIKKNDYYLKGHFPGYPILPGVLLVESMAQTAGILCSQNLSKDNNQDIYFLTKITDVKFKHPVLPGSTLLLKAEILNVFNNTVKTRVEAEVNGMIVAEGELVFVKKEVK
jgi:3-hydroxyacyl-[acyl-carrier-protein] dehydratase